jgi:cbb3-type cytochrome oxidase maturation protein
LLGAGGLFACLYCIRGGQYDDLSTPPLRVLIEDREDEPEHRRSTVH